jgi:Na+/melibiose symporter-like transporter
VSEPGDPAVPVRRLPFGARVLYGVGSMSSGAMLQIGGLILLYYNQVVGLSAQLASLALAICVIVDAFWEPLVGYVSDHLRTAWGRRHPLMYLSALPIPVFYILLFNPPRGLSQDKLFLYLLVVSMAGRMSTSLYDVPSGALAPELAPGYHDRTALLGYRWLLGTVGGAIAAVLAYGVFLRKTPHYPLGQLNPAGYPPLAASIAFLIVASILVSSFGTQRYAKGLYRPRVMRPNLAATARELAETLNNWNLGVAIVAGVVAATSTSLSAGLTIYFSTYFWRLPASSILVLVLTGLVSTPLAVWVAPLLARRWGKKIACMTLFFLSVVTANGPIVLRLLGLFPPNGAPILIYLLTGTVIVTGVLGTGGFILVTSMIADIVEETQVKTGRRSEGLLFAADGLINKIVSGFTTVLPGILLVVVGFPKAANLATLDPHIMTRLALIYVPLTSGLSALSIACWGFYRIDAASHARNLASIAAARTAMEADLVQLPGSAKGALPGEPPLGNAVGLSDLATR